MKITLFMATSINGYVTGQNDDTDWVKDTEILYQTIRDYDACIMGSRTYVEAKKYNAFPYKGAVNIVLTHDQELIKQSTDETVFTDATLGQIITQLENRGFSKLIVIGGGKTNSQFLSSGLIDQIVIDVHPIIIDQGIKLFEDIFPLVNLELVDSQKLGDGLVQNRYMVLK